jgi:FkbM family methyltransferase
MLTWLLRNSATAIRHPEIGFDYLRWRAARATGSPLLVNGAFGTRLRTSTFADLRSTRHFVPRAAEVAMIEKLSSRHPVFFDVGANVGAWSLALAAAHRSARVFAFEPAPGTFEVLRQNIALNRVENVDLLQLALSDRTGELAFQINQSVSIFNRLLPTSESAVDLQRGRFYASTSVHVQTMPLEDFCRDRGIERIGFLKIDVEGAEQSVLRGARQLLRRRAIERIWIEVDPDNLREMGDSIEGLAATMSDAGYTFHLLRGDGNPGPPVDVLTRPSLNMLAIPAVDPV